MAKPDPQKLLIMHCRKITEQHQEGFLSTNDAVTRLIESFLDFEETLRGEDRVGIIQLRHDENGNPIPPVVIPVSEMIGE